MSRAENPTTAAEQLHILATYPRHPAPRPQHPETGCHCSPCVARDMAKEQRAEAMAEERAWASGRDCDWFADRYFATRGAW